LNSLSQGGSNLVNPTSKDKLQKADPLDDAYKAISWMARQVAKTVGYEFGDEDFDNNVGKAISGFMPARTLCKRDEYTKMLVHALAGAWKAVK